MWLRTHISLKNSCASTFYAPRRVLDQIVNRAGQERARLVEQKTAGPSQVIVHDCAHAVLFCNVVSISTNQENCKKKKDYGSIDTVLQH